MADLQNKGGMLRIKRKREEEAVPMLLVTKSSVKGTIPLKRRKQGDNCDKTNLETSSEQDRESGQNEIKILNTEKPHECTESIFESSAEDYVYDVYVPLAYTPDILQANPVCFGVVMVSRTLEEDNDISFEEIDSYDKYSDDEDSNAEDFYQNSYPDEDEWPNSDIEKQEI
ncbi:hypothetical protein MERGE_000118 [Pneumocystis wakefieldiae]|uniref:Transcription factor Iwr1 domain-containing protein n=1 Tax=Pneumocystis wakefieldiae TaxID=38082 RepID=A0A899FPG2_9ASCO|nr:hypothetical protein MERGE_000118 [Pneumocystis wakefieldiae]